MFLISIKVVMVREVILFVLMVGVVFDKLLDKVNDIEQVNEV